MCSWCVHVSVCVCVCVTVCRDLGINNHAVMAVLDKGLVIYLQVRTSL